MLNRLGLRTKFVVKSRSCFVPEVSVMRARHYSPEEAHYSGTDDCGRESANRKLSTLDRFENRLHGV
jgi:hypothetical protein